MKKKILSLLALLWVPVFGMLHAEEFLDIVTLESNDGKTAVFTSVGVADKKPEVVANATKSLMHTLFYLGVEGIRDGKPLIDVENKLVTNPFFNETNKGGFYVTASEGECKKNAQKKYQGTMRLTVNIAGLIRYLTQSKVLNPNQKTTATEVDNTAGMTLPTIMVMPYVTASENEEAALQGDYDLRRAVNIIQEGFQSKDIIIRDYEQAVKEARMNGTWEDGTASSNLALLLETAGADVYVQVDFKKDVNAQGMSASLSMKAYEGKGSSVLAAQDYRTLRYRTTMMDEVCRKAVEECLPSFLEQIIKNFNKGLANGTRVELRFSIAETSATTFNTPVGPHNYALKNIINQWVRRNSHQGKYHMQGAVDERMIFDYVMIPPIDKDGLKMDASQFAFYLESYLKEEVGIDCRCDVQSTGIYVTIY